MARPRWPPEPGRRSSDRCPSEPPGLSDVARSRSALHRTRMVEGTQGSHPREGRGRWPSLACCAPASIPANASSTHRWSAAASGCRSTTLRPATSAWRDGCAGTASSASVSRRVAATRAPPWRGCAARGLSWWVFQPAQVRAYARFVLQRAKNDKIDAALIAECTAAAKKIHAPADPRLAAFAAPLTMLDQLGEDIACLKNRRESCREARIERHWTAEIARLKAVRRIELRALAAAIRQHPDLAQRLDLLCSIDGIGLPTALAILVRLPEIGRV